MEKKGREGSREMGYTYVYIYIKRERDEDVEDVSC